MFQATPQRVAAGEAAEAPDLLGEQARARTPASENAPSSSSSA